MMMMMAAVTSSCSGVCLKRKKKEKRKEERQERWMIDKSPLNWMRHVEATAMLVPWSFWLIVVSLTGLVLPGQLLLLLLLPLLLLLLMELVGKGLSDWIIVPV